jgi:mRNA-degrading endonuclease RelE of RelBE toxin-antitoxin system
MPSAEAALEAVPSRRLQLQIRGAILRLERNPRHEGARSLWDDWQGYWRVRVAGPWRILYIIDHPTRVWILRIEHRATVYAL